MAGSWCARWAAGTALPIRRTLPRSCMPQDRDFPDPRPSDGRRHRPAGRQRLGAQCAAAQGLRDRLRRNPSSGGDTRPAPGVCSWILICSWHMLMNLDQGADHAHLPSSVARSHRSPRPCKASGQAASRSCSPGRHRDSQHAARYGRLAAAALAAGGGSAAGNGAMPGHAAATRPSSTTPPLRTSAGTHWAERWPSLGRPSSSRPRPAASVQCTRWAGPVWATSPGRRRTRAWA